MGFFPVLRSFTDFSLSSAVEIYQINLSITDDYFSFVRYIETVLNISGISYSTDSLSVILT